MRQVRRALQVVSSGFHRILVVLLGFTLLGVAANLCAQSQQTEPPPAASSNGSDGRLGPQDLRVEPAVQTTEGTPTLETHPDSEQQAPPSTRPTDNYIIGPEDVLDIDVFNVPELAKSVRVANDGTIALALIGRVEAAGLTSDQLREKVEKKYGETYLQDPHVGVFVREFHAQPVSVIGAVEQPGLYQLTGPRTLIEMLSMAGGLAKRTSAPAGRNLYVTRKGGFGDLPMADGMQLVAPDKLQVNIRRLLYSNDDSLNIQIQPLDTISVTKADVVYVVGAVRKAGGFVLEDRETVTVMQALALAEGFFGSPAKGSARIIRQAPDGSRTEIPVNLKKVLEGKAEDVEMAANDILFVPDSAAKTAMRRSVEAAISTISGVVIFRR
jgi:polysaccharide export outer membrane protein